MSAATENEHTVIPAEPLGDRAKSEATIGSPARIAWVSAKHQVSGVTEGKQRDAGRSRRISSWSSGSS